MDRGREAVRDASSTLRDFETNPAAVYMVVQQFAEQVLLQQPGV